MFDKDDLEVLGIGILSIILVIGIFVGFIFIVDKVQNKHNDKQWNNGHCPNCEGTWTYEQAEIVLTILGYGVVTLNVFAVCSMIEQVAKTICEYKWGKCEYKWGKGNSK